METTKILWSGLTGRTGREAVMAARDMSGVEITLGITRHDVPGVMEIFGESIGHTEWVDYDMDIPTLADIAKSRAGVDIIVDFSHPDVFERIIELAMRTHVPLISGTSGLSNRQMALLYDATNQIPIFRGGNFRFKVKKFIDEAVEFMRNCGGDFTLFENFYEGKSLPSETSKVIQRRASKEANVTLDVHSAATLGKDPLICDWEILQKDEYLPGNYLNEGPHCRVVGFDELAHDVLEIAKVMKNKPIKKGEFYDLDEIWDEIPAEAKVIS